MKRLQIVRMAGRADKMISKRCAVRRTRENWWVRCDKIVMFNGFRCHCDDGRFPSSNHSSLLNCFPPRFINEFLISALASDRKIDGNLSNPTWKRADWKLFWCAISFPWFCTRFFGNTRNRDKSNCEIRKTIQCQRLGRRKATDYRSRLRSIPYTMLLTQLHNTKRKTAIIMKCFRA